MSSPKVNFKVGSRKAFSEESRVVDAAKQAAVDVAEKYGNFAGGALFKVFSRGAAVPTVHPQAVDIVRHAVAEPRGASASTRTGNAERLASGVAQPERRSGIAEANEKFADSLRRIGFHVS